MKQKKFLFKAMMILAAVFVFLQSSKVTEAASYKYGDFAVTELSTTSVAIDYRNLYYETINGGAAVLGYQIYMQDYTEGTGAQLVTTASTLQVYGSISGLLAGHEYSVQVRLQYQYPGVESNEMYYNVQFTTPYTGISSEVDVVSDTSTPGESSGSTSGGTSSSGSNTSVGTPSVSAVKMVGANVGVVLNGVSCDGYEYGIYQAKSNTLVKSGSSLSNSTSFYGLSRKAVYYVRARAYIYASNGDKLYSQWSGKKYFVPQPKISKKGSKAKKNRIILKWTKVSGANKYTIYIRKRGGKKWSKVKTVSGKKSAYTITKYKGKKINVRNHSYEVTVRASSKLGGKTYKSGNSDHIYTYTKHLY